MYLYCESFHLKEHPVKHCSSWILQNDPSDLTNLNLQFKFYWALWSGIGQIEITIFSIPVSDSFMITLAPAEAAEVLVLDMQTRAEECPISNDSFCVVLPILTKCWSKYIVSLTETCKSGAPLMINHKQTLLIIHSIKLNSPV